MRTVEAFVVNMFTTKSETQQKHLVLIFNRPSWVKLAGFHLQTHLVCLFGLVWLFTCEHILDKTRQCRSLRVPPPLSPRLDSCSGWSGHSLFWCWWQWSSPWQWWWWHRLTMMLRMGENENDENGDTMRMVAHSLWHWEWERMRMTRITLVAHSLCRVSSQCGLHSPRMGLDKRICTWCGDIFGVFMYSTHILYIVYLVYSHVYMYFVLEGTLYNMGHWHIHNFGSEFYASLQR